MHRSALHAQAGDGDWTLEWDDTTARVSDPTGRLRWESPSASLGLSVDHGALVHQHTIILNRLEFGRLRSGRDPAAAAGLLRAIYPLFVAEVRQRVAIAEFRREHRLQHLIHLLCGGWVNNLRRALSRRERRRRALLRALRQHDTRGWPTELPASLIESANERLPLNVLPIGRSTDGFPSTK